MRDPRQQDAGSYGTSA